MTPKTVEKRIDNFKERAADKARTDLYDTEYWACLCFRSREQLEEFLQRLGFDPNYKYIDGMALAEAIGERLPPSGIKWPTSTSSTLSAKDVDELAVPLPVGRSSR